MINKVLESSEGNVWKYIFEFPNAIARKYERKIKNIS